MAKIEKKDMTDQDKEIVNDMKELAAKKNKPKPTTYTNQDGFFEKYGINVRDLQDKRVMLNVGKSKITGVVLSVNTQFLMLRIQGDDGYIHSVKINKISDVAYRDVSGDDE